MKRIAGALVALGMLAAACGGSSSSSSPTAPAGSSPAPTATSAAGRMLRLGSGTYSESDFRTRVRAAFLAADSASFCRGLRGLSDRDAAQSIIAAQSAMPTVQAADAGDQERAAAITKEECARLYP